MPFRQNVIERSRSAGLVEDCADGVWLDDSVNAVIKKLREIGEEENTLFIFTTDHPTTGKGNCHLGRIPLLMKWPGNIPAARIGDTLLAQTDLAPTILDMAGYKIPDGIQLLDGISGIRLLSMVI